jgi:response regulator RpfG family c-di-GMP phosphodiesterase/rubredoxin
MAIPNTKKSILIVDESGESLEQKESIAQLQSQVRNVKMSTLETIHRLTEAAEYRDEDSVEHNQRMSHYAAAVARQMGANDRTIEMILLATPMHDIGKTGIPDRILLKPGKLGAEEWLTMKKHTIIGGNILSGSKTGFIRLGEIIALSHHEKWDGSGYPHGLVGKSIPLIGQIVAIADVFDALTTSRPYKQPFSLESAYDIIREGKGNHFKPAVVEAFFAVQEEILAIKAKFTDSGYNNLFEYSEINLEQADLLSADPPLPNTKHPCAVCESVYRSIAGDPENGIAPGTSFDKLDADWSCPLCGVSKEKSSAEP